MKRKRRKSIEMCSLLSGSEWKQRKRKETYKNDEENNKVVHMFGSKY